LCRVVVWYRFELRLPYMDMARVLVVVIVVVQ